MASLGYIQVVRFCNQECRFCSNLSNKRQLDFRRAKKLVDRYAEKGYDGVILTGGEPTLYTRLPDLIAYCRRKGMPHRIITNGSRLCKPAYARKLAAAGLELAHVSVHSHIPKIQDHITSTPDSMANILRTLVNLRTNGVAVAINQTICRQNADHVHKTVQWLCEKFPYIHHFSWTYLDTLIDQVDKHLDVIPTLKMTEASLLKAMDYITKSGRSVRLEKVPLCYMGDFAHLSTETRALVTASERDIHFLDDRGYHRESSWSYDKPPSCRTCSLDRICAGLWDMGRRYDPAELRPQSKSPEPIIRRILGPESKKADEVVSALLGPRRPRKSRAIKPSLFVNTRG